MRQGKNKRARGTKDGDSDTYMNVPADSIHSDAGYSRSHTSFHIPENYRAPPIPSRMTYASDRDVQPRLRRNGADWRHADLETERYPYVESYSRDDRTNYDEPIPRSTGSWRDIDHSTYNQSRNDWSRRYDNGASSSSFPEPTTWGMVNPPSFEHGRAMYPERWEQTDPRSQPLDDWGADVGRVDRRSDRRHHDWRSDSQRDKNSTHKFQSDSGWDSRRRDRLSWGSEPLPRHNDSSLQETPHHVIEERAWEPAASWKSSTSNDNQQRGQNGQRNQPKNKRGQNHNRQRREWRTDDGDLNNWTKRDTSRPANKPPADPHQSRRKHPRSPSPSRSRSRSPTGSYKSFRSSRGRSRSRSFSPASKRRRRDSSRITMRSRTPSERSVNRHTRFERYSSRSPSPNRSPISLVERRRSPSAVSTTGSDRSISRSPVGNARSIHRLPSNPVTSDSVPIISTALTNNGFTSRKREGPRNGKGKTHQQDRRVRDARPQSSIGTSYSIPERELHHANAVLPPLPSDQQNIPMTMPPPSSIPVPHGRLRQTEAEYVPPPTTWLPDKIDIAAKPIRTMGRNAGFKPIGKTNSSLKKFFPGDDDDMDFTSDDPRLEPAASAVGTTTLEPSTNEVLPPRVWGDPHTPQSSLLVSHHEPFHEEHHAQPCQESETPSVYVDIGLDRTNGTPLTSQLTQDKAISVQHHQPNPLLSEPQKLLQQEPHESQNSKADRHETHTGARPVAHKDLYKILTQVGEGTFGKVYKAQNTVTSAYVALKRIRMEAERDGFPVTAMREIKLLQSLRHSNVVRLYEMMVSNGSVYMVFEYMDHDLTGVLSQTQFTFLDEHLKSLCHQMLSGLAYLHHKGVIHRDIKGSNILINNRGELKLADFGLARFYQKRRRADYTNRVITLWYRPPELLFGATVYGPEVDMWSAGCIMLELFTKKPIFQGADEIHQLDVIFRLLGTPTVENWPDVVNLPWYELVKPHQAIPSKFREAFQKWMSPAALDLAQQLLAYDPTRRITAMQAIEAPYFSDEMPLASPPIGLVDLEGEWHELETKRERAKRKERKTVT